jgi:hypothetical protein
LATVTSAVLGGTSNHSGSGSVVSGTAIATSGAESDLNIPEGLWMVMAAIGVRIAIAAL